ncbi:hypothetical protein GCM10025791_01060 [Halioxenophilus aromaticivorans]|uniref:Lipoprotein n=1 Tax=Halioxenophilus aromaticivorans TaxID=1306992 RepID=A0AAV3TWC1_9ALTE
MPADDGANVIWARFAAALVLSVLLTGCAETTCTKTGTPATLDFGSGFGTDCGKVSSAWVVIVDAFMDWGEELVAVSTSCEPALLV